MSFGFNPGQLHTPHVHMHDYKEIEGRAFDWQVTKQLLRFLQPHIWPMLGGLLLMLASSGLALLTPYLIKLIIDEHVAVGNMAGLTHISLLTMGVYIASYFVSWSQSYVIGRVGNNVLREMRHELFEKYQVLSMRYYDENGTGSLIARMLSDVGVINELLSHGLVGMIGDVFIVIAIVIVMLALDTRLALLTFMVLPPMVLATIIFGRYARDAYRRTREKVSMLTGRLAEDLGAMRVIQAFAEEERTSEAFDEINADSRDANMAATRLAATFTPAMEVLSVLATGIILWFGGRGVASGVVTIGLIIAFLNYVSRLFQPVLDLSMIYNTWQAAMAGGERLLEILRLEPDIKSAPDAIRPDEIAGRITFENVDFAYLDDVPVLQDVSFEAQAGDTFALVGPTGAGKTTIASLLMRFYDVTGGAIKVDGVDIRQMDLKTLREQLGVVPQEPYLFQGSIAYNIAYGRPDATREDIEAAARAANADEFIQRLPEGYDTEILEGAANISLGQRQLVCLARVILAAPRILILDEATSSVDLRTEGLIQDAMDQLMAGRTSLVIAHRLATVQRAERILVIDDGRIVERGTHEALLAEDGVYAQLYRTQFLVEGSDA